MKFLFIIVLIIVSLGCWIFATAFVHNGKHDRIAFIFKSIFYWFAVVLAFCVGCLM